MSKYELVDYGQPEYLDGAMARFLVIDPDKMMVAYFKRREDAELFLAAHTLSGQAVGTVLKELTDLRAENARLTAERDAAQPVAWRLEDRCHAGWYYYGDAAKKPVPQGAQALYAHPAPNTLRQVMEAADFARNRLEMLADDTWNGDARDLKRSLAGIFAEYDAALALLTKE